MAVHSILVVDDNEVNLKLLRAVLAAEGYRVSTAGAAEEALAVIESCAPDLILMDIQLPGMSGLELTRRLKSDPMTRGIRIVGISAYAMKGDEGKALTAGCDGYVTKPIDVMELPQIVAAHLKSRAQ